MEKQYGNVTRDTCQSFEARFSLSSSSSSHLFFFRWSKRTPSMSHRPTMFLSRFHHHPSSHHRLLVSLSLSLSLSLSDTLKRLRAWGCPAWNITRITRFRDSWTVTGDKKEAVFRYIVTIFFSLHLFYHACRRHLIESKWNERLLERETRVSRVYFRTHEGSVEVSTVMRTIPLSMLQDKRNAIGVFETNGTALLLWKTSLK